LIEKRSVAAFKTVAIAGYTFFIASALRQTTCPYTQEEQQILDLLAESYGRPLTAEEAWLSLEQARPLGELPEATPPTRPA
jgi:hypothetical protein